MNMVRYEWCVDTVDEHDDRIEVCHWSTYADCLKYMSESVLEANEHFEVCVIRDKFDKEDPEDLEDRQWAYMENGVLPDTFDGGAKMPKRFHDEVAKATA